MAQSLFDYKLAILMKEWDYVQAHIGRFDSILFNIRTWAVSVFSAMVAVAASQKIPGLMLLAMLPVLMFWFIDALFKSFQRSFIFRGRDIETYLSSTAFADDARSQSEISIVTPGLSALFRKTSFFRRLVFVLNNAMLRNVSVIYFALLSLCALAYVFLRSIV